MAVWKPFNLSAAMASGVVTWFVGHPLAFVPMPAANQPVILDGMHNSRTAPP